MLTTSSNRSPKILIDVINNISTRELPLSHISPTDSAAIQISI